MQTKYLLALNAHPKIGGQTIKKVLAAFDDDLERVWQAGANELEAKVGGKIAGLIVEARNQYDPDQELERLQRNDIGYITVYDKSYPRLLLEAIDCPAILYIKGDVKSLSSPAIGVVGSRKFSIYGKTVSHELSKECAKNGLVIISGLALGIDTFAHRAAMDGEGITVGVLGCGLDKIYPSVNQQLAKEIIEKGGAVISEFTPGTPPLKQNFPARNRIIAGLSLGVLVIEAAEHSGALITAYSALDYNREVFAVPGNIDQENSKGTNLLVQNGAKLVMGASDILDELNINAKKAVDKSKEILPKTEEESALLELLATGEKSADSLIRDSGLNVICLNSVLTMMEMKGMVENIGGGRYKRKN